MFKFGFDLDDEEPDNQYQDSGTSIPPATPLKATSNSPNRLIEKPFVEISLSQLLDALPSLISYSPLTVPLSSGERTGSVTLARRDLFDARFQLISEGSGNESGPRENETKDRTQALEFLDAPSDLVPGVYEGGLKTWECSLDLVDYLDGMNGVDVRGKRVLEIGCGTAVPTLYILREIFSSPPASANALYEGQETYIHVQDYNASVLELVTLPNIILAWYMSSASATYRTSLPRSPLPDDEYPPADSSRPSNLPLPLSLRSAFQASLREYHIHLRFFSGSWESFDPCLTGGQYNLVLTSETIYRSDGLRPLIKLMKAACGRLPRPEGDLDELTQQKLSLRSDPPITSKERRAYLCLVAAKILYFGVGGGVSEFVRAVEGSSEEQGKVETVWEKQAGVGRRIMRVHWAKA